VWAFKRYSISTFLLHLNQGSVRKSKETTLSMRVFFAILNQLEHQDLTIEITYIVFYQAYKYTVQLFKKKYSALFLNNRITTILNVLA